MSTSKRPRQDVLSSSASESQSPLKRSKTEPPVVSPKDLSGIFTQIVPLSVVSTPSKSLARRMLAKSSTESSIITPSLPHKGSVTDSTGNSKLTQAMSLPSIFSSSPSPPAEFSSPPLPPSPLLARSKANVRTYSQVRSFLVPLSLESFKTKVEDNSEEDNENGQARESYSALRTRLGVDHSEDNPFHVSGLNNDLSTITELRSKGEARRFLDEIGYLFEGLEVGVAASVRRSSASEIVANMCDPEFMRKAKATDFINHVWDALIMNPPDKVLDLYIAVFIALVARDRRDIDNLCRRANFFDFISRLMGYVREEDAILATDTRLLKSIFTRPELSSLVNLRQIIAQSGILSPDASPSLRGLISYTLAQLPISTIPSNLLCLTQQHFLDELDYLHRDIEEYNASNFTPTADLPYIRQYLSLLDSTLMTRHMDVPLQEGLAIIQKPLISKLTVLYGAIQCSDPCFSTLHDSVEELLRILINLSNLHSSWTAVIIKERQFIRRIVYEISSVVEINGFSTNVHDNSPNNTVDKQCLALALLSNLVLMSDGIKDPLRETPLNRECLHDVGCILQCDCASQTTALQVLTSLFVKLRIKLESQNHFFFQVHVAALLCLLSIDNPQNHMVIMKDLQKENALLSPNGLKESIQSFEKFYNPDSGSGALDSNTGPMDIQMQGQIREACRSLCSY